MKKQFLMLPLVAAILTACSSNNPAPVVSATDSTTLSPGVMQPVANDMGSNAGWQATDVQPVSMPTAMSAPMPAPVSTPVPSTRQPKFSNAPITEEPVPETVTKTVKKTKTVAKKVDQNFEIPRDANNAPIYSQIQKGFYNGANYTVRKGDTMFLIAYIAGKDVKEIARLNNMSEPYQLVVGQSLNLGNSATETVVVEETVTVPVEQPVTYMQGANGTTLASNGNVSGPIKAGDGVRSVVSASTAEDAQENVSVVATPAPKPAVTATAATAPVQAVKATVATANSPKQVAAPSASFRWQWPTEGRVVSGFSSAEGGNKGVDIAGKKGQTIRAAADGKVVYAGNALEGYGNLIIIKHSDDFLSAYAHNDSISVDEQDSVKAGEKIGTMGSTGTNSNKLHFEIRYKGKSVDPTRYLPRR